MENSNNSFASVLKRESQSHVTPEITKPALVLDDTCIKEFDFGMSLMGRAKDVSAIPNLPSEHIQAPTHIKMVKGIVLDSIEEYVKWKMNDLKSLSCKHLGLTTTIKGFTMKGKSNNSRPILLDSRVKEFGCSFSNSKKKTKNLSSDGESTRRNAMEDFLKKPKSRWTIEVDENFKYFHVQDLERPVTYEEVKRAVLGFCTDQITCPDGFSFEFYRNWTLKRNLIHVKWDYLDETLKAFGFGLKWRNWISSCLNNAMGSVLVNGSPTLEFQFHKGLKQDAGFFDWLLYLNCSLQYLGDESW
ncbi:hypothetical protein Tco_1539692 [Tanacetum coccineum]